LFFIISIFLFICIILRVGDWFAEKRVRIFKNTWLTSALSKD